MNNSQNKSLKEHWNSIFVTRPENELGWHENDANQTLRFLDEIPDISNSTIFLPGAGTSILADVLLSRCGRLILNDLSDEALKKLKERIRETEKNVLWLLHDISKELPMNLPKADIWIDRAVLHFLLEESDIQAYFNNLRSTLNANGYVLLAEFSADGAPKCAGLDLHRYSIEEMKTRMGSEFTLRRFENYTFINPFGEPRPYVYALFRRNSAR